MDSSARYSPTRLKRSGLWGGSIRPRTSSGVGAAATTPEGCAGRVTTWNSTPENTVKASSPVWSATDRAGAMVVWPLTPVAIFVMRSTVRASGAYR